MGQKSKSQDWPHEILKELFKNYSGFDVYINDFLRTNIAIPTNDTNLGRKVVRILQELEKRQLITWSYTDHKNEKIGMPDDYHDNTTVSLDKYRFHVRLTFDGLVYIGNYLRDKKQVTFNAVSLFILGFTGLFVLASAYFSSKGVTSKELQDLNTQLQNSTQQVIELNKTTKDLLDSIQTNQKSFQKVFSSHFKPDTTKIK